jgi:hypothetical protein
MFPRRFPHAVATTAASVQVDPGTAQTGVRFRGHPCDGDFAGTWNKELWSNGYFDLNFKGKPGKPSNVWQGQNSSRQSMKKCDA